MKLAPFWRNLVALRFCQILTFSDTRVPIQYPRWSTEHTPLEPDVLKLPDSTARRIIYHVILLTVVNYIQ